MLTEPTVEACALDEDSNLLDASKITWYNNPDDETPIPNSSAGEYTQHQEKGSGVRSSLIAHLQV